jgi:ABC-2 type transport system permease protein
MQVFKTYFRIIRASIGALAVTTAIFLGISVMVTMMAPSGGATGFVETRTPITVINRDAGSPLAEGLSEYLAEVYTVMEFPDDEEKLQDALFWRNVDYIAIIPEGFSETFMAGEEAIVDKVIAPGASSSRYIDMRIDKFLNAARLHRDYGTRADADTGADVDAQGADRARASATPAWQSRLVAAVRADLTGTVEVTTTSIAASTGGVKSSQAYSYYFAYMSYALLAMAISGISSIMMAFNKRQVHLRTMCTPMPSWRMNVSLVAGHAVFSLACWILLAVFSVIIYGNKLLGSGLFPYYIANSLAFTVVAAAVGLAVGSFVRTGSGLSAAVNVIALGMSFLSGVFVPQSVMSPSVLSVSKFLPAYWYVRANDAITALTRLDAAALAPVYQSILIQLGFAVAIVSVTLLMSRERASAHL